MPSYLSVQRETIDGGECGRSECTGQRQEEFRRAKDAATRCGAARSAGSVRDIVDIFKFAPAHYRLGAFGRQHRV